MSANRSEQSAQYFHQALKKFEEALILPHSVAVRDMAILRFMLTYETCWKAIKWKLYEEIALEVNGPKPAFQEGFRQGWLGDEISLWIRMIDDRNHLAHTYNEVLAEELFERLPLYSKAFIQLAEHL